MADPSGTVLFVGEETVEATRITVQPLATPGSEPAADPRVVAIGAAAKKLDDLRERWLNPEDASEADLKKRTLTNLYNARPQWLRNAHAALDRAVWAAYGWDDADPATVEEDVTLSRLLALNLERAGSQYAP